MFSLISSPGSWTKLLRVVAILCLVSVAWLYFGSPPLSPTIELDIPQAVEPPPTKSVKYDPRMPPLWGWEHSCLPDINRTWFGGTMRTSLDPPDLELPISFWSAIPSVRDNVTTIVIIGPQYSTARHLAAPNRSPRSNFPSYKFECFFPSLNMSVRGRIEEDPHRNLGIIKCILPPHEPMAMGKTNSTTVVLHDLTHQGFLSFTTCMMPSSSKRYEFAAVITARNIACHLEEWLENAFLHGVDQVFFYDHFNDDIATHAILKRYIEQGLVTVFPWRMSRDVLWGGTWDRAQIILYNDALNRFNTKWLLISDVDEFLFFAPETQPPDTPSVTFFNQTKYADPNVSRPLFELPPIPHFTKTHTREQLRTKVLNFLDTMDEMSNFQLGSVEIRHLLFGTMRGTDNSSSAFCPPDGRLKLREQVMRGSLLPSKAHLSQIARKYVARTERSQIVSIHMIAKGGPIYVAPMDTLRLHHYWRGPRSIQPHNNMWVDVSAVRWADVIEERIQQRRNGTLVGYG